MNRDEAFELELGRWLEEGPYEAPVASIAAALAHVRAYPRRPRTLGSLWRHVMSGTELRHLPSQSRPGWLPAAALVAGIAVVVVGAYGLFNLGGQTGAGGVATPTPVITPAPTPAPTPRPTPSPMPTLGPGMSSGVQTCGASNGDVTTTVDEVVQTRGGVMECTHTSSDPRLAGESTITMDYDEHPDGLWLGWGRFELRNDGGRWSGSYAVTSTASAGVMDFDAVWIGSGGYEGLEVLNHVRVSTSRTTITSRVFESGPTVTGTETCSTTTTGRTFAAGELTAYRGVSLRCVDTMGDSRLSGTRTLRLSIDERADESAELWGTTALENDDGAWEGFFFGTVDPGYTTHRVQTLMRGTGSYEGLFLRLEVVGDGTDFDLTGEVITAG